MDPFLLIPRFICSESFHQHLRASLAQFDGGAAFIHPSAALKTSPCLLIINLLPTIFPWQTTLIMPDPGLTLKIIGANEEHHFYTEVLIQPFL